MGQVWDRSEQSSLCEAQLSAACVHMHSAGLASRSGAWPETGPEIFDGRRNSLLGLCPINMVPGPASARRSWLWSDQVEVSRGTPSCVQLGPVSLFVAQVADVWCQ